MKKTKKVTEYIKQIKQQLKDMMFDSFHKCKHENPEIANHNLSLNGQCHKINKLIERMEAEYRRETYKSDSPYAPVKKGDLY